MKINNNKYVLLLLAIAFALASCNKNEKKNESKETETLPEDIVELREDQAKLANIELGAIEMRSISGILKVTGLVSVAPQNLATVSSPLGGYIINSSLLPGSIISKGQVLATIENQEFIDIQQNYLESLSKLEYAEAEYKRQSELYRSDVASQKNLQQITSDYKSLRTQVKALREKLSLIGIDAAKLSDDDISKSLPIVSPISGFLKSVNVNIGKYVAPSDILFEIVNSDKMLLELTLYEKDADKVSNGQRLRFFINNETEKHEAIIYQVGKAVNTDKSIKVFASVSGNCKNVIPGMYVNAIIEATSNKVASVPNDAIISFDDKDYIFVYNKEKKEDGKPFTEYRMIQVSKGVSDEGFTEINLPEGFNMKISKVVTKGAYSLLSAKKNAGEMAC